MKYPEMKLIQRGKHLRIQILHKNEDSRSKDQNKDEFHFVSPAMKTNVNRIFFIAKRKYISGFTKTPSYYQ